MNIGDIELINKFGDHWTLKLRMDNANAYRLVFDETDGAEDYQSTCLTKADIIKMYNLVMGIRNDIYG